MKCLCFYLGLNKTCLLQAHYCQQCWPLTDWCNIVLFSSQVNMITNNRHPSQRNHTALSCFVLLEVIQTVDKLLSIWGVFLKEMLLAATDLYLSMYLCLFQYGVLSISWQSLFFFSVVNKILFPVIVSQCFHERLCEEGSLTLQLNFMWI